MRMWPFVALSHKRNANSKTTLVDARRASHVARNHARVNTFGSDRGPGATHVSSSLKSTDDSRQMPIAMAVAITRKLQKNSALHT